MRLAVGKSSEPLVWSALLTPAGGINTRYESLIFLRPEFF